MVAMGERFEMRVDEETLSRVDRWRAEQDDGPSRAEAMRRLVDVGLAQSSKEVVTFTDGEKLLLLMMRDLYKHLGVAQGETVDTDFISDVIYGGHYWAPTWEFTGVFHDHRDDPSRLHEVLDILEMWDCIERGFEKLTKKEKAKVEEEAAPFGKSVRLPGFDGNNESEHLGIASFLVNKMDRFTRFAGRDLNSHMPSLDMHERMLRVFRPIKNSLIGGDLGASTIISLLKAMPYPKGE